MPYIGIPLVTDANQLSSDILARLMTNIPGWVPREGNLEVQMIEVIANIIAENLAVATRVDRNIFRTYGQEIVELAPIDGAPATIPTTWVLSDTDGHTIPAGTTVAHRTSAGVHIPFVTVVDVIVPTGESTTEAGAVEVASVEVGRDKNGFAAVEMTLVDSLVYVESVTATEISSGGLDAESDDEYLARLVDFLKIVAPRPIYARDFAIYARQIEGVVRATGLDNYDPDTDTFDNEKMVTLALIDADGADVSDEVKDEVTALFEAAREVNFVVNLVDPTRTEVDVTYNVRVEAGYNPDLVKASINSVLTTFLQPSSWGSTPEDPVVWNNEGTVRFLSVAGVIESVPGVRYIISLEVNGGTVDVELDGAISLPTVGTITGVAA